MILGIFITDPNATPPKKKIWNILLTTQIYQPNK